MDGHCQGTVREIQTEDEAWRSLSIGQSNIIAVGSIPASIDKGLSV